ncbi:MAG: hypothetical protein ACOCRK_07245 [bacterium]
MPEEKEFFGNFATVVGRVNSKQMKDFGSGLGKLSLNVNDGKAFVDLWNPKDTNVVESFFHEINEGEKIQLRGEIQESYYNENYNRRLRPFIPKTGVEYSVKSDDVEEKFNAALSGDVVKMEMKYDEDGAPSMELIFVILNLYNPNTKENDLTRQEVLIRELENYKDYVSNRDDMPGREEIVEKLINKTKSDDSRENIYKVLMKFYDRFNPRMWNINILHLTAFDDIAQEIADKVDEYDNCQFGVSVYNMRDEDEFGFINGIINKVEIKKINQVVKQEESLEEDDDFLGDW